MGVVEPAPGVGASFRSCSGVGADPPLGPRVGVPVIVAGAGVGAGYALDPPGVGVAAPAGAGVGVLPAGVGAVGAAHCVSMGEHTIMETHLQPSDGGGGAGADVVMTSDALVASDARRLVSAATQSQVVSVGCAAWL